MKQDGFSETRETGRTKLSKYFIEHLNRFPKLKFANVKLPEKEYALIKKTLESKVNILRVLILQAEKSDITDSFILDIRENHAVYCDYEDNWVQLCVGAVVPVPAQ